MERHVQSMEEAGCERGRGQPSVSPCAPTAEEAEALIRAMGLAYSNTLLYGLTHKVTLRSMEDAFEKITAALDRFGELNFSLAEEALMINGSAVETRNPVTAGYVRHLAEIDAPSFSLEQGLSPDHFAVLLKILNAKPEELQPLGGINAALASANLEHVRARRMIYKRMAEDDVVLSREKMAAWTTITPEDVKRMADFLKSPGPMAPGEAGSCLKRMAAEPARLGQLIVESAQERKGSAEADSDESLTAKVVDSLQRVFREMTKDPAAKTQKGKKELEKTLAHLEEAVKSRIAEISGQLSEADAQRIAEAVEGMTDELRMDALVAEYMKKRQALDKNEERLLRFIKHKGLDKLSDTELEARLLSGGLSAEGWRELLAKSGLLRGGEEATVPVVGHLADLLSAIQESVSRTVQAGSAGASADVGKLVARIDEEVKTVVQRAKTRIQDLIEALKESQTALEAAEQAAGRGERRMTASRKKLFSVLAELGQELCQPLAVVSCSLDMMVAGSLGAITEGQRAILKLAAESAQKIKVLIDYLISIAGVPETRSPDAGIQASLYGKAEKAG